MAKRKTRKDRHQRLLAAGFFPPEMPSCFYSEKLAPHSDFLFRSFTALPQVNRRRACLSYQSNKANVNFPRFRREDVGIDT